MKRIRTEKFSFSFRAGSKFLKQCNSPGSNDTQKLTHDYKRKTIKVLKSALISRFFELSDAFERFSPEISDELK